MAIATLGGFLQLLLGEDRRGYSRLTVPQATLKDQAGDGQDGPGQEHGRERWGQQGTEGPMSGSRRRQPTAALRDAGSAGPNLLRF